MSSRKKTASEPRVVQQYTLDLGDGAPPVVSYISKTAKPYIVPSASAERDLAIAQALENERRAWRELHDRELTAFLIEKDGAAFLAEDFRRWFMKRGHVAPHHPNVWGAMWMTAARHKLVDKTARMLPPQDTRSHARLTTEWARHAL